ncbi:allophanate hydrolase subunit 1 [Mycobacterium sp. JS623]|uniref:5-oxoprolinase subunit B family protein n=1 Tax=Mycobacterium sp. JS623 TaxID=212767 RepID=UPI0002A570E6|nr:allophanate hydrolase subunit 1 [Mycobacterium sp. JS623]AGB20687.1 allophanate hydrolase subunit 1 [Mycobacterium sp. JS623]
MSVTADLMDVRALGTVRDYGDQALLLEFDSTAEVLAWADALREAELLGVLDIVPASRTVLLKLAGPRYQAPTRQRLGKLRVTAEALTEPSQGQADIEIGVVYDGADLEEVSRLTGLTTDQVIAAHTRTPWRVGFGGFAPGFAYLIGGDERLNVPRQSEPRTKVPAGSVALAGEFSAIYPRESPGGWQLIGQMADDSVALWDIDRDPPALLRPGMWVQFREVKA